MKKIGILGGLGWPSTVEYYARLCTESQKYFSRLNFSSPFPIPEIVIESLNIDHAINFVAMIAMFPGVNGTSILMK